MTRLTQLILWAQLKRLVVCLCLCVIFALVTQLSERAPLTLERSLMWLPLAPHLALTWGVSVARGVRGGLADACATLALPPRRWLSPMLCLWLASSLLTSPLSEPRAERSITASASRWGSEPCSPEVGSEGRCFWFKSEQGSLKAWAWSGEVSAPPKRLESAQLKALQSPHVRRRGEPNKLFKRLLSLALRAPLLCLILSALLSAHQPLVRPISLWLYPLSALYEQLLRLAL